MKLKNMMIATIGTVLLLSVGCTSKSVQTTERVPAQQDKKGTGNIGSSGNIFSVEIHHCGLKKLLEYPSDQLMDWKVGQAKVAQILLCYSQDNKIVLKSTWSHIRLAPKIIPPYLPIEKVALDSVAYRTGESGRKERDIEWANVLVKKYYEDEKKSPRFDVDSTIEVFDQRSGQKIQILDMGKVTEMVKLFSTGTDQGDPFMKITKTINQLEMKSENKLTNLKLLVRARLKFPVTMNIIDGKIKISSQENFSESEIVRDYSRFLATEQGIESAAKKYLQSGEITEISGIADYQDRDYYLNKEDAMYGVNVFLKRGSYPPASDENSPSRLYCEQKSIFSGENCVSVKELSSEQSSYYYDKIIRSGALDINGETMRYGYFTDGEEINFMRYVPGSDKFNNLVIRMQTAYISETQDTAIIHSVYTKNYESRPYFASLDFEIEKKTGKVRVVRMDSTRLCRITKWIGEDACGVQGGQYIFDRFNPAVGIKARYFKKSE